jgi:hypothetical protein
MYWTHHFSHHDTLGRARSWIEQLGFAPDRIEVHADGVPRLTVTGTPHEIAEVGMLINALERSDPRGWPSFWDVARLNHVYPSARPEPAAPAAAAATVIGWHPPD